MILRLHVLERDGGMEHAVFVALYGVVLVHTVGIVEAEDDLAEVLALEGNLDGEGEAFVGLGRHLPERGVKTSRQRVARLEVVRQAELFFLEDPLDVKVGIGEPQHTI